MKGFTLICPSCGQEDSMIHHSITKTKALYYTPGFGIVIGWRSEYDSTFRCRDCGEYANEEQLIASSLSEGKVVP